jgi:hypothetical protein
VIIFSISNFPHQHVYFNSLVSHGPGFLRTNYERDYWGTSYKQALEYVLNNDGRDSLKVAFANAPGRYNLWALDHARKDKIQEGRIDESHYFITEYRFHPQDYPEFAGRNVFEVKVQNSEIVTVFKLK